MTFDAHLILGTPVVDAWAKVTDRDELTNIPALEDQLHLWDEGRMHAWLVEMDTKYCMSEAVNAPYAPTGEAIARFEVGDDSWQAGSGPVMPTDFVIPLPPEGEWRLRVLGGRYDHLVVLMRTA